MLDDAEGCFDVFGVEKGDFIITRRAVVPFLGSAKLHDKSFGEIFVNF